MPDKRDWGLRRERTQQVSIFKDLGSDVRMSPYGVAVAAMAGWPSKTITRSARYVAMMKSCSITKAVFFACRINLLKHL